MYMYRNITKNSNNKKKQQSKKENTLQGLKKNIAFYKIILYLYSFMVKIIF